MSLRHQIWGKERGNFDPSQDQEKFLNQLAAEGQSAGLNSIFAPTCAFTNRIVQLGEDDLLMDEWFIRTRQPADGGIVEGPFDAVAFFNADCPIVAVHDKKRGRLAVLHAGYRCLIPAARYNRRSAEEERRSIIQVLFEDKAFSPSNVEVFVGYGVGPCCYGFERNPSMRFDLQDGSLDLPIGRATRGPRAWQKSIDLYALIEKQLGSVGVPEHRINVDYTCMGCFKDMSFPLYYSNCYDGPGAGRNASLAWFTSD